jgi:hypothetical protein
MLLSKRCSNYGMGAGILRFSVVDPRLATGDTTWSGQRILSICHRRRERTNRPLKYPSARTAALVEGGRDRLARRRALPPRRLVERAYRPRRGASSKNRRAIPKRIRTSPRLGRPRTRSLPLRLLGTRRRSSIRVRPEAPAPTVPWRRPPGCVFRPAAPRVSWRKHMGGRKL